MASGKVGFIGLGIMGMGMAKNLLKSGRHLVVWNRSSEKCAQLGTENVVVAASPREVHDYFVDCASYVEVSF